MISQLPAENLHSFQSAEALAKDLARAIVLHLDNAITKKGSAWLAVSGGSTPKRLFAELSSKVLAWENVNVTLVDERWVEEDNPRSNAVMVKQLFLRGKAAAAKFVPLHISGVDEKHIDNFINELEATIPDLEHSVDVMLLGMGGDGHTASLFPGADKLADATNMDSDNKLMAITAPGADEPRITMTLPMIVESGFLALHIEGANKLGVLELAASDLASKDSLDALPIRHVLKMRPDLQIYHAL